MVIVCVWSDSLLFLVFWLKSLYRTEKAYVIKKGPKFAASVVRQATDLTADMIARSDFEIFVPTFCIIFWIFTFHFRSSQRRVEDADFQKVQLPGFGHST